MQASHPAHLFQSQSQQETGVRRAAKAASSSAGNPIYLGRKQDDAEELAAGGAGADGGKQKVLDALVDGDAMWTAESGGSVRRVDLCTGQTTHLLLAHKAPVSALAIYECGSTGAKLLLSAGWDKSIHIWSASSDAATPRPKPLAVIRDASTDFIKALHALPAHGLLLSGGSDKVVRVWDMAPFVQSPTDAPTPRPVGSFSEHTRAVTCIQSLQLPRTTASSSSTGVLDDVVIYTADSMGRIFQLSLSFDRTQPSDRACFTVQRELRGPETSVLDLTVGWVRCTGGPDDEDDEDDDDEYDEVDAGADGGQRQRPLTRRVAQVWVASNDKTAQLFEPFLYMSPPRALNASETDAAAGQLENLTTHSSAPSGSSSSLPGRTSKVGAALGNLPALSPCVAIPHPDHVKSVLALGLAKAPTPSPSTANTSSLAPGIVMTGSADEDIRVFAVHPPHPRAILNTAAGSTSGHTAAPLLRAQVIPLSRYEGHWHEVERLCLWKGAIRAVPPHATQSDDETAGQDGGAPAAPAAASTATPAEPQAEWHVISTGLDASIRRWKLRDLLILPSATSAQAGGQAGMPSGETASPGASSASPAAPVAAAAETSKAKDAKGGGSGMTEEEERELEELMMDDD